MRTKFGMFFLIPQLDNHEIKPGKSLKINISVPNLRLFVGNIPKSKGKEEILDEFGKLTGNVNKRKKKKQTRQKKQIGTRRARPASLPILSYISIQQFSELILV